MSQKTATSVELPRCPECAEPARGTLEMVEGIALACVNERSGVVEYQGETEILWDTQQTVRKAGKPVWVCGCGCSWPTDPTPE